MSSQASFAQDEPPYDPAVDVQLFDYAIGPKSFVTVTDGNVENKGQFSLDFLLNFFTDPFTVYNYNEETEMVEGPRARVIEDVLAGQLAGAYGLTDRLHLGVSIPMIFSMSGEGLSPGDGMPVPGGLQATGLGDILVEAKIKLLESNSLRLAATAGVTAPTSVGTEGGDFSGDDLPTGRLRAAVQWQTPNNRFSLGANIGAVLRKPRTIYATEVGQQLLFGAAAAFHVTDRLAVVGELFGRGDLGGLDVDTSPVEAGAAARFQLGQSLSVLAGGGAGLTEGLGAPGVRLYASVGYAPDFRDSDADGIANQNDKCPLEAEDKDGYQDQDGCPDNDNDGDFRADSEDKCPLEAEDIDGFQDDDGCPDNDNDKDGITDFDDRCPEDAEDGKKPFDKDGCPAGKRDTDADGKSDEVDQCVTEPEDDDGFEDWDGCPDDDNDKDGVPDADDLCKLCMEDKDGFEDHDGCPDFDNDRDGIADANDQCQAEPETVNGVKDTDGCPDQGGRQLASFTGTVVQLDTPVDFDRRDGVKSKGVLDQAALVMLQNPEVTRWRVVVAAKKARTDEQTRIRSQKQADAIRIHLVSRGVSNDRIEAIGAVSNTPTVAIAAIERNAVDPAEDGGLSICPAEFQAKERPAPEGGLTAMPAETSGAADKDSDGVLDTVDQCPDQAGPVENRGCPDTDFDEDGVIDRVDNCPDEKGTAANQGCIKKQLVVITQTQLKILDLVYFDTGKAKIQKRSNVLLDNVAQVLIAHPEIKRIRVEGHTDDQGNDNANRKLSQRRADAVRDYLKKKGVAEDRLESIGHGEDKPIAPNSTKEGRAANRRVEFNIVQ